MDCDCSYQMCCAHVIRWSAWRLRNFWTAWRGWKRIRMKITCWAENLLFYNVHFSVGKQWYLPSIRAEAQWFKVFMMFLKYKIAHWSDHGCWIMVQRWLNQNWLVHVGTDCCFDQWMSCARDCIVKRYVETIRAGWWMKLHPKQKLNYLEDEKFICDDYFRKWLFYNLDGSCCGLNKQYNESELRDDRWYIENILGWS